ncbi:MAG: membrane carboxypeptidase, penicillin-binding protein [uncultured Candidatus Thioglobus sp.]|nr:MAG: membrane carboxypeptidase, penicillin-binding protein [uncultured Candidatus Thioglobus sp.]
MKKTNLMKWLKRLIVLGIVVFLVYLNHLNNIVKDEFSKPIGLGNSHLQFDQHPKPVINMLLLVEDQSFFEHSGVDFKEILRVLRDYTFYDKPMRGASTITQQLIKNTLLTRERKIDRKVKEILMALLLEYSFDKEFILNRYMNTLYLGQKGKKTVLGFANASRFYFKKELGLLSLEEIATLVALVKGPSYYHPIKYPQRLAKRAQLVLSLYHRYEKIVK